MSNIPVLNKFTVTTPSTKVTIFADDTALPPNLSPPSYPSNLVTVTTSPIQTDVTTAPEYTTVTNFVQEPSLSQNSVPKNIIEAAEGGEEEAMDSAVGKGGGDQNVSVEAGGWGRFFQKGKK